MAGSIVSNSRCDTNIPATSQYTGKVIIKRCDNTKQYDNRAARGQNDCKIV